MNKTVYLDSAATTNVTPEVLEEMLPWFSDDYGNPSSMHEHGFVARKAIEESREKFAAFLGCHEDEVFFTSGGSESNNMVINRLNLKKKDTLITSVIEHHSVLNAAKSLKSDVIYVPVDNTGLIDKRFLEMACARSQKGLVSIMMVNNELGTIEPVDGYLSDIVHDNGFLLHTDATQALGKMDINVGKLGVDFLSASAHKIHGPKGVGLLYAKRESQKFLHPLIKGGQQESGLRAGTENVAGIVGFTKALDYALERRDNVEYVTRYLVENLVCGKLNCMVNGLFINNIGSIANMRFDGVRGDQLVEILNEHGIYCSSGSACNSKSKEPSHVLRAIGLTPEQANSSVRFSLDSSITIEDIDYVLKVLNAVVPMLKGE